MDTQKDEMSAGSSLQSHHKFESSDSGKIAESRDSEDLSSIYNQPKTGAEKVALAKEKTENTAKALKNKFMRKINGIKSGKVKNAVIFGGIALVVVILIFGGIFLGRVIHSAYIAARDRQTERVLANLGDEMTEVGNTGTDEEKQALIDEINQEAEQLKDRGDKQTWKAYSIKAGAEFNAGQYNKVISSLAESIQIAPDESLLGLYERLYAAASATNNFQLKIETIREMLARDVFGKAVNDPLADWSKGYYTELLKSLEGGV